MTRMRQMRSTGLRARCWAYLCIGLGAIAAGGCQNRITDADIKNLTLTELRLLWLDQQENPGEPRLLLIDPRRRDAFEGARLPGALHITLPDLAQRTEKDPGMDAYRRIVVYAEGPGALTSRAMTKRLLVLGHKQARLFGGGVVEWADAGFPIESGQPASEPAPVPKRDTRRPIP